MESRHYKLRFLPLFAEDLGEMDELAKGRKSGEEQGYLSLDDVESSLGISHE